MIDRSCQSNWTIELAAEVPDHAWDLTDTFRPFDKVLCTFWESPTLWASLEADPVANLLRVRFSDGTSSTFKPKASTVQTCSFLRGSPVLVGIRCESSGSSTTGAWKFFASVGGTEVFMTDTLAGTVQGPRVRPTQIRFGDKDKLKAEAMLWYGGRIFENEARTDQQVGDSLRNMDMLYIKTLPVPPGGMEA